jgi:hypothetical protein
MESYFLVGHLDVDRLLSEWRWLCPQPMALVAKSAFGDLFLRDEAGKVFKLDIAIGQMKEVASSETEFRDLACTKEQREHWFAESDEQAAKERGLKPNQDQCIAFKTPIIFAEAGTPNNAYVGSLYEQVSFLGHVNLRIHVRQKPMFFPPPTELRGWLEAHHDKLSEQFVGWGPPTKKK